MILYLIVIFNDINSSIIYLNCLFNMYCLNNKIFFNVFEICSKSRYEKDIHKKSIYWRLLAKTSKMKNTKSQACIQLHNRVENTQIIKSLKFFVFWSFYIVLNQKEKKIFCQKFRSKFCLQLQLITSGKLPELGIRFRTNC